jgi:hypothetical protein
MATVGVALAIGEAADTLQAASVVVDVAEADGTKIRSAS